MANSFFKASDETQSKILSLFDCFLEKCIVCNDCLITKGNDGLFSIDNLKRCKDLLIDSIQTKPSTITVSKHFKDKLEEGNKGLLHILAHIDWLYTLTDGKLGKYKLYETDECKYVSAIKIKNIEVSPFFPDGVCSFGQSVSAGKSSAMLFFLDVFIQVKSNQNITADNIKDEIMKATESLYCQCKNNEESVYKKSDPKQGKNILMYLCDPVKFDGKKMTGNNYPIVSSDDDTIRESLKDVCQQNNGCGLITIANIIHNSLNEEIENKQNKSKELAQIIKNNIDWKAPFYTPYIMPFWSKSKNIDFNEITALRFKKAIILYGPPGTSKTYQATEIAKAFIREKDYAFTDYIKQMSVNEKSIALRIHHLQLHPNYTYEDFIWGYQIEKSKSVARKGYLLRLIDEIKDKNETHFLILDELNRVDLSRIFGEVFSALESPRKVVDLQQTVEGTSVIKIPDNLYIIGTMNEIDFSLERVDFALRRRFIWFFYGYNPSILRDIINSRLNDELSDSEKIALDEFILSCTNLNKAIDANPNLGQQFELGHTVFADIVFIKNEAPSMQLKTCKKSLWNFSIKPMLESFLGNLDKDTIKNLLREDKNESKQGELYKAFFAQSTTSVFDNDDSE